MGAGLIVLSVKTQRSIVNDLSIQLQEAATDTIISTMYDMFSGAESDLLMSKYPSLPPLHVSPLSR
jgi:hypothetical protein